MRKFSTPPDDLSSEKWQLLEQRLRQKGIIPNRTREAIPQRKGRGPWPLSFAQQRLWFLDQLEPGNVLYTIPYAFKMQGVLSEVLLSRCLSELVRRHESLRTVFHVQDDEPVQYIQPAQPFRLSLVDLQTVPAGSRDEQVHRLARQEATQPFDLARGPLLRAYLVRVEEQEHVFLLTLHHILFDARSFSLFVRELSTLYRAFEAGLSSPLPDLPIQYADYAIWQRTWLQGEVLEQQVHYWREQLARIVGRGQAPFLQLPTDFPRPPVQRFRGQRIRRPLPAELSTSLSKLAHQEEITLFMLLLSAFEILLARYSGQQTFTVGTPVANRMQQETEGLIGLFVNTLVMRADLSGQPTFRQLLARVREVALGAYAHQDVPFEHLVEVLQPERDLSRSSLFQVMFGVENLDRSTQTTEQLPGLTLSSLEVPTATTAKFDLSLDVVESPQGLHCVLEYNTDLFAPATVERLMAHFQTLLEGVVQNPHIRIWDIPLLTETERAQVLAQGTGPEEWNPGPTEWSTGPTEWNATPVDYPQDLCIHQFFEQQVQQTPNTVAVVCEEKALTYDELNRRANQLAHLLRAQGVGPDVSVGICLERSLLLPLAVLSVLKAGAAYVPLDPAYPAERLAYMIEQTQVSVLLTTQELRERLSANTPELWSKPTIYCVDAQDLQGVEAANLNMTALPDNLVYIIYTSGSTGQPKGTAVTLAGFSHMLNWFLRACAFTRQTQVLVMTSFSFDLTQKNLLAPLLAGGTLILFPPGYYDPRLVCQIVEQRAITFLNCVPHMFYPLLDSDQSRNFVSLSSLQRVFMGGESMSIARLLPWLQAPHCQAKLITAYGPTECTDINSFAYIEQPEQFRSAVISIGQPLPKTRLYLLDAWGSLVPQGVVGELYIGGEGVARGYLGQPALTAECFVPNPFVGTVPCTCPPHSCPTRSCPQMGTRLYRTGDLMRYREDGRLEFVGRLDQQVEMRGMRIELGEIEATLQTHPLVREAVLLVHEKDEERQSLVAYVTGLPGAALTGPSGSAQGTHPLSRSLQTYLSERLPAYMVPTQFVWLDALPKTPNGKVDRRTLPAPEEVGDGESAEARTPIEEVLVGLWNEVLDHRQVGIHENFFELGGHSLLATRLISRVRAVFGVEVPLRAVFEKPTIAELAEQVEHALHKDQEMPMPPLVAVTRSEPILLSFAQQRLWFLDQLEPESTAYLVPIALRLQGHLYAQALEQSLQEIVCRHESLRTTFEMQAGQPVQVIHPVGAVACPCPVLPVIDLQGINFERRKGEAQRLAQQEALHPCNLAQGPLLRTYLLQLERQEHVLLMTLHHIISDRWSSQVLTHELTTLYQANVSGFPRALSPLPIQYADYTLWQREWLQGEVLEAQLVYWRKQLADLLPLELPTDHPRPAIKTDRGASQSHLLPKSLLEQLLHLCQKLDVTLFMLLLTSFQVLLMRYTGQTDISIGTPTANRTQAELEGMIGFFVNTLVLRTDLAGHPTFLEALRRVREVCLGAYMNQDIPFEKVVAELAEVRDMSRSPLFQVMLVLQNIPPLEHADVAGMSIKPLPVEWTTSKFDLTLFLTETEQGLSCNLEYSTDLFEAPTMTRLLGHFQTQLEGIVQDPQARLFDLPLLTDAEREQLLVQWNATQADSPHDLCVHQLFEQQVEQTPDAVALVFEEEELTYAELNRRANQLAHHLQHLGAGPDRLVGICMERSPRMVMSLLAVLKAGGAYVPLDPELPAERLIWMLQEVEPRAILTQTQMLSTLALANTPLVNLDTRWPALRNEESLNPLSQVLPENLMYVIYTSGSTGKPKGAMNTHRGLCNRLCWMQYTYQLTSRDRVVQKTPFSFDVSVWEVFWPLMTGACLIVATPGGHRDPNYLKALIIEQQVTTLHFVPTMLQAFLQEANEQVAWTSLRQVFCSGEALSLELQTRFFAICPQRVQLHNLYGPTEASIDVTSWSCQRGDTGHTVPIGRPIANTQIYLLDRNLQPAPVGVRAELYIGGVGLACGYWQHPELTAEKFIPNPFVGPAPGQPGMWLYRTGDQARYLPNGVIEYLGRIDTQQVKLRGYRIELPEIEATLRRHAGVHEAIVILHAPSPEEKRLIAYLVPDAKKAFPILQLLHFQRRGRISQEQQHQLPNGMTIISRNKSETRFMYHEIFEEQTYIKNGITIENGDCVFDVGANIGIFGLFVGQNYKNVSMYAFEPIPAVFELLHLNVELYQLNAKLFACGLSNEARSEHFTYYPDVSIISGRFANVEEEQEVIKTFLLHQQQGEDLALSSHEIDELLVERLTREDITCPVQTLSEVIREESIERIDLLKIDVEKSELDVLAGIEEEDWQKVKQIVIEVHDIDGRVKKITNLLKQHGYHVVIEQDMQLHETGLYNVYAVHPSRKSQSISPIMQDKNASGTMNGSWTSVNTLLSDVRSFLKKTLPDYMVPASIIPLEELPLTPNGKVDRKALEGSPLLYRENTEIALRAKPLVAPQTPLQEQLALIWAEVLRLPQVGIHDNFFELGGDSILSLQIMARARQRGLQLTLKQLFQHQTIEELSSVVDAGALIQAEQGLVLGSVPLTPIQHWFFDLDQGDPHHWNQSVFFKVGEHFKAAFLQEIVSVWLTHHDALRLRFRSHDGEWHQTLVESEGTQPLCVIDLSQLTLPHQDVVATRLSAENQASLNLVTGQLLRVVLFDMGKKQSNLLFIVIHHLAVDGVSWRILLEDLQTAYRQLLQGQPIHLPAKTSSFKTWAEHLEAYARSRRDSALGLSEGQTYWLTRTVPQVSPLPRDFPTQTLSNTVASGRMVSVELSPEETKALLEEVPSVYHTHINEVLLTAVAQTLAAWTGSSGVLFDLEGHGREDLFLDVDVSRTVGWFTSLFPVYLDLGATSTVADALNRVKEDLRAIPNHGIDYGILRYLSPDPTVREQLQTWPAAEVVFNYLGQFDQTRSADVFAGSSHLSAGLAHSPHGRRTHLLDISAQVSGNRLRVTWGYSEHMHLRSTIERLATAFMDVLRSIIAHAQSSDTGGYTPADFPDVELSQKQLEQILVEMDFD